MAVIELVPAHFGVPSMGVRIDTFEGDNRQTLRERAFACIPCSLTTRFNYSDPEVL
jgi:hypothetical protein